MPSSQHAFTASQDWFSHNIKHWNTLLAEIKTQSYLAGNGARVLEIGSWEGRSAVYLAEKLLKAPNDGGSGLESGGIVCIDHFDLFKTEAGRTRYERVKHNLELTGKTFRIIPEFSFTALTKLLCEAVGKESGVGNVEGGFDWVYIDGSHRADDTFLDGELVWRLTREGGIIIFDDYLWDAEPKASMLHPKRGIDAFLLLHDGEYERLSEKKEVDDGDEYQVVIRKTIGPRIGFLLPEDPSITPLPTLDLTAFEYGMNVAVTVDSTYAMPLAVLLTSMLKHTPGRISLYIVDCGLSEVDIDRIRKISAHRPDVTTNFLALPTNNLTQSLNSAVWAKIDVLDILPVERVLYMDADTMVRGDLRPLWKTSLDGRPLAAAIDVGHPIGHDGVTVDEKYFNAGVLLIDLAMVRGEGLGTLKERCVEMKDAIYADQDALNVHFSGRWKELSVVWNAQGLGTYARFDAPGRHFIDKKGMSNPSIVHFTGPVHPPVEMVLYPFTQPYTSKPWGYARAPGHPYEEEWMSVLQETEYWGYFNGDWKKVCEEAKEKRIEEASAKIRAL